MTVYLLQWLLMLHLNETLGSDLPVIEESSSENNGVFIAPV